jgi:hypothetical protein
MNLTDSLVNKKIIDSIDENKLRYVGWTDTNNNDEFYNAFFSVETMKYISKRVTQNLNGLKSKPIVVGKDTIGHVMSQIYDDRRPKIGDIFTRYTIEDDKVVSLLQELIFRCIELISSTIRDEIEIIQNNEKLSVWTTVLGDFNKEGLRSHDKIKIRNKHPQMMAINMNY